MRSRQLSQLRRLSRLELLAWGVVLFAVLQVLLFSFGRDQSIYGVVAHGLINGRVPYRDLWDFKPPGIFAVYAISFSLFGSNMLAPRLLEAGGMLAMVFLAQRLCLGFFGSRQVGLVGAAIAALLHAQLEFWHSGQPETFGAWLVMGGLLVTQLASQASERRVRLYFGVGVLFGLAFLLKPPLGGGALVCAAFLARLRFQAGRGLAGALLPVACIGGASLWPLLITVGWFWYKDGLTDLYWTLAEFTPGYTALGWQGQNALELFYYATKEALFGFSALLGVASVVGLALGVLWQREREGIFLILGVCCIQLAGVAMQGKFFQYHYAATLPLLCLIAGLGVCKVWLRIRSRGTPAFVGMVLVIALLVSMRDAVRDVPHGFWARSGIRLLYVSALFSDAGRAELDRQLYRVADFDLAADREVALAARELSEPGEPIYVWGFEPAVYFLGQRRASSRFIYNVAQRAEWEQEHARRLLMNDLSEAAPKVLVVQHNDIFPGVTGNTRDSAAELAHFPELARFMQGYTWQERIEDFDLYVRTQKQ